MISSADSEKRRSQERALRRQFITTLTWYVQTISFNSSLLIEVTAIYMMDLKINLLYVNFAMVHYPQTDEASQLMYVFYY